MQGAVVVHGQGAQQGVAHGRHPLLLHVCQRFSQPGSQPGYCLVGKIPPPRGGDFGILGGWVGVEMGGWVSPKFQHFGPPGTPPPPPRVQVRFFWDLGCAGL